MKKLLLTVTSAFAAISMMAQTPYSLPNAGFETWSSGKATSWAGYGDIGLLYGAPSYTTFSTYSQDATNKNSGNFSIQIKNRQIGASTNIEGIAWLGTAGTNTNNIGIYGIPFSYNINGFGGYFRYSITAPSSQDTATIYCQTTKWTGTQTLADNASFFIGSNTTGFVNQNVPATHVNSVVPDTLWIIAFSSYWPTKDSIPTASNGFVSTLNMDDLTLTVMTGVTAPVLDFVDTRFAPNPASDEVRFTTSAKNIGGSLKLFDALGKEVLSVNVTNALDNRFSVSNLPAGVYFYQVINTAGEVNAHGKLVVTK